MSTQHNTSPPASQRLLWPDDPPASPANRTLTSQAAADSVNRKAPRRREIIFSLIQGRGARGATIDELQAASGWLTQSICPRVNELARQGAIEDSGETRPTRSGRSAIVWRAG